MSEKIAKKIGDRGVTIKIADNFSNGDRHFLMKIGIAIAISILAIGLMLCILDGAFTSVSNLLFYQTLYGATLA